MRNTIIDGEKQITPGGQLFEKRTIFDDNFGLKYLLNYSC